MTLFTGLVAATGMSLVEAKTFLGQGKSTVLKKSNGTRTMTKQDVALLRACWDRVRRGDVEDLPAGCVRMAEALAFLRGVDTARKAKPKAPTKKPAVPTRALADLTPDEIRAVAADLRGKGIPEKAIIRKFGFSPEPVEETKNAG